MELDYGTMALSTALMIKKNLIINDVALVTDKGTADWLVTQHGKDLVDKAFDEVILIENEVNVANRTFHDTRYSSKAQPYYNTNRVTSYDISPFDETVLIDADYLVLDNSLDCVWGSADDIMVNKSVRDLRHVSDIRGFDSRFNDMSIPLYWATVMYFKKTERVKSIFDLMKMVKANYNYYQELYKFSPSGYYRNDYALSIALHMISGQFENDSVNPLPMDQLMFATEFDDMIGFSDGVAYFVSEAGQGDFYLHKVFTNVHVMNKWSMVRMSSRIIEYAKN
jgi:hypothetical protein